eukprot:CAMPEP_0178972878 /NCGR_PEP_ID=MMETSP0789-20121207/21325_1 /TAXON_ID=3005 /ORGANISM="Rhizosolenia setigera, Strain CCMP 1694" /LENGTH=550 /DNA_ID=CAMNT_0020660509 /DNA_START=93 /DNA_END=1745 /DNA_ORIENTATION=-
MNGNESEPKIVGGQVANKDRYGYIVSLVDSDFNFCGGSLIEREWVLSAAHCAGVATHALIGRYDFNDPTEEFEKIPVEYEIVHPEYNDQTLENDIMLMKLQYSSELGSLVTLDDGSSSSGEEGEIILSDGVDVTTLGWGTTSSGGSKSSILLDVDLKVVDQNECNEKYQAGGATITDVMFCAASPGKDSCQGDSGGPLVIKNKNKKEGGEGKDDPSTDVQVGVVSWGFGCADASFPGVYARVSKYIDFIQSNTQSMAPTISSSPTISTAPTNSPTVSLAPSNDPCSGNNKRISIRVKTDQYPSETSWILKSQDGIPIVVSPLYVEPNTLYIQDYCILYPEEEEQVEEPCFEFTIYDEYGDGFLDGGYYIVFDVDENKKLIEGRGNFGSVETKSSCDDDAVINPCLDGKSLAVYVKTDQYPQETQWTLSRDGSVLLSGGNYTLANNVYIQEYCDRNSMDEGDAEVCYKFSIFDSFGDGLSYGEGFYAVLDKDEEKYIIFGEGDFTFEFEETSCLSVDDYDYDYEDFVVSLEDSKGSSMSPLVKWIENIFHF